MPLDPTLVPALEKELEYAKHVAPGGQKTDPGRIAAIEAEIALHRSAAVVEPEATDASNDSTDYRTSDTAAEKRVAKARERAEAAKETARAQAPAETTDATDETEKPEDDPAPETASE